MPLICHLIKDASTCKTFSSVMMRFSLSLALACGEQYAARWGILPRSR